MSDTRTEKGRGEIEDLLPWYANGRLTPAERRRVEAALTTDPELARRLELVREEMAEAIAANEAILPASSRALDRLMAGIEAAPRPARPFAAVKAGLMDRLGDFLASLTPRRLAHVAAAVAVVVAIQAAALTGLVGERSGATYGTASQGEVVAAGPTLLVAFAPEARIEAVSALLKRHGASLAEGPKANGFYRLRLAEGADAAAVAEAMKTESGLVTFVQATR
ncbi:MAG: zf-HC2 domain-containing protein [Siculibacillus sp.]|nr:zf-HC2 domain-containing protein [Siculibacillus sp.]